jgi:hypothetical protein
MAKLDPLLIAVVESILFLELTEDDNLDPDLAVKQLETIYAQLAKLSVEELVAAAKSIRTWARREEKTRGLDARVQTLHSVADSFEAIHEKPAKSKDTKPSPAQTLRGTWTFQLRARVTRQETIEEKYQHFVQQLASAPEPWGMPENRVPRLGKMGEFCSRTNLSALMPDGVRCELTLLDRSDRLTSNSDDFLVMTLKNPTPQIFTSLCDEAFPAYVTAFRPYLAWIAPESMEIEGKSYPRRKRVGMIFPANYWDRELCQAAFNMTPRQVKAKFSRHVESCMADHHGVSVFLTREAADLKTALAESKRLIKLVS